MQQIYSLKRCTKEETLTKALKTKEAWKYIIINSKKALTK